MNEKILIVKDTDDEIFYAAVREIYDDEDERTIISTGKTEYEALKNAAEAIFKKLNTCCTRLRTIGKSLAEKEDFYLSEEYQLDSVYVDRDLVLDDGRIINSFNSLAFDSDLKRWVRYYK